MHVTGIILFLILLAAALSFLPLPLLLSLLILIPDGLIEHGLVPCIRVLLRVVPPCNGSQPTMRCSPLPAHATYAAWYFLTVER